MTAATPRKLDRSASVGVLVTLALINGMYGLLLLMFGQFLSGLSGAIGNVDSDGALVFDILRGCGALGLVLCAALLRASRVVGRGGSDAFVLSVVVIACAVDVVLLGVSKMAVLPVVALVVVAAETVVHKRASASSVAA